MNIVNTTGESKLTTVDGEVIKLFFGMIADRLFSVEWTKDTLNDLKTPEIKDVDGTVLVEGGTLTDVGMALIAYTGYINQCTIDRKPIVYDWGFFIKHLDECQLNISMLEEFRNMMTDWSNSRYSLQTMKGKSTIEKTDDKEPVKKNKKKNITKNSSKKENPSASANSD